MPPLAGTRKAGKPSSREICSERSPGDMFSVPEVSPRGSVFGFRSFPWGAHREAMLWLQKSLLGRLLLVPKICFLVASRERFFGFRIHSSGDSSWLQKSLLGAPLLAMLWFQKFLLLGLPLVPEVIPAPFTGRHSLVLEVSPRCQFAVPEISPGKALFDEACRKLHRGDSNPCGKSPMDFESISLIARTPCHCLGPTGLTPELRSAFLSWLGPPRAARGSASVRCAGLRFQLLCKPSLYSC